jgi:hypothetical protein
MFLLNAAIIQVIRYACPSWGILHSRSLIMGYHDIRDQRLNELLFLGLIQTPKLSTTTPVVVNI